MWYLIFKNGVVYPIRVVNLAHLITYVKSIDVQAQNNPLNRSDSDHHGPQSGGNGLHVSSVPGSRV